MPSQSRTLRFLSHWFGAGGKKSGTDWPSKREDFLKRSARREPEFEEFSKANAAAIEAAVTGQGSSKAQAGARMVANISSAHIPAFCEASRNGDPKPYKNAYDLAKCRIGDQLPRPSETRKLVDAALPLEPGQWPEDIYFGAVELNGTGVRFYGDMCLVLRLDALNHETIVLDRNSYDLVREPICNRIRKVPGHKRAGARKREALKLMGRWQKDLGAMAALKAFQSLGLRTRRYTTGQISEAVRDDEDYLEVLKVRSFGTQNLQEARTSASVAAYDALVGDRIARQPAPRMEALIWRNRRQRAEEALRSNKVAVQVVTTPGRTKE